MNDSKLNDHNEVLEALADEIEIPGRLEERARARYKAIGDWLNRTDSTIAHLDPKISPQGSFLLGTAIKPTSVDDAYDVDLVVTLEGTKQTMTMDQLKRMVGSEVIAYARAQNMKAAPEDKRRCWTMEYSDEANFHVDVLPSIPDVGRYKELLESYGRKDLLALPDVVDMAIGITDKELPQYTEVSDDWPVSNPKGYGAWFNLQQEAILRERRQKLVENMQYASVEEVPAHRVKTSLQRAIQLLKRHRDLMFAGDEDKPISIIITTLAAHAYDGEQDLRDSLRTILRGMRNYIQEIDGEAQILNPVNPQENFADKWPENFRKKENFDNWLKAAQQDFGLYFNQPYNQIPDTLARRIGENVTKLVSSRISKPKAPLIKTAVATEAAAVHTAGRATKPWAE